MKLVTCAALLAATLIRAHSAETGVPGVTQETYGNWPDALSIRGGDTRIVVVPSAGGRPLHWSVNGENILFENPAASGRTLADTPNGFSPGGAQIDLGPELRYIPRHDQLWLGAWTGRATHDHAFRVTSPPDMALGIQLEKEFTLAPDTGELGLVCRMRNITTTDTSFCLWDRTLCKGGGFALIPLNSKSRFKARWSIRRGPNGSYVYDGKSPSDERVRVMDNVLVVQARAVQGTNVLKVGTDTFDGWIAYARGKVLYVKHFPAFPDGNYSDGGNTAEFYCSDRVAEVEPLSPEVRLKPGENYSFPEKWTLIDLPAEVTTFQQARAAVKLIPKSPFK